MPEATTEHGIARTADGVNIAYQTSGQGPALVCCHAMGWDHTLWDQQRSVFSRHHQLITFDQRGAGGSDHPPFTEGPDSAYTVTAFGDDLRAVLDALNIERATLLGFSMGAVAVLSFATRWPERLERLVLASAMASRLPQAIIERARLVEELLAEKGIEAAFDHYFAGALFEGLVVDDRFRSWFESVRQRATPHGFQGCFRVTIDRPSLVDQLHLIKSPTLVLVGERDTHYLAEADLLARTLPDARKIVIANAGHPMMMREPAAFEGHVMDFLR